MSNRTLELVTPSATLQFTRQLALAATAVLLSATALMPELWRMLNSVATEIAAVGAVALVVLLLVWLSRYRHIGRHHAGKRHGQVITIRSIVQLVLHLWPVGILTLIYPIASQRMAGAAVSGVPLTSLLLAVSLTVPWLSQGVCMPLYRAIGPLIPEGDAEEIRHRFCEVWPLTFAQSLPTILLFAVPVQVATQWSMKTMSAYVVLCVLDLAFAQSLVVTNMGHRRFGWALAWTGYATPLLVFPTAWYLPPLLGLVPQLILMRRFLRVRPLALDLIEVLRDVVRGLLLGSVLWADKLFYFLKDGNHFAVETVFLALLPAVLAYNYYFIRLAPGFDSSVASLRIAMEKEPIRKLGEYAQKLFARVQAAILRTAFAGALLSFSISWAMINFTPDHAGLIAGMATASWLFMMTTVLCYKIDYIGQHRASQGLSGAHLLLCGVAFVAMPAGSGLYFALAGFELLLFFVALRVCLTAWRTPEYTFFWRHATAW
ncbi:MAG: hypothetical protein JO287_04595 [Pseudonocardiales bacterium]|nr:hypothetical protein [Pseudonocardiales bacterium]